MKKKIVLSMLFFALISVLFAAAGDVVVKNGEVTADENITADFFFGDGSFLTGIASGGGNCSADGSCPLITYDSELSYIGNCSVDNSCSLVTYDSETSAWDKDSSNDITTSNIANQNVNGSAFWANADGFNASTFQVIGTSLELIWTYFTNAFVELTDSFGGDVTGTYDALSVNDNSHLHSAANITTGTFGAGDFTFPDNVIVNDNITVGGAGNGLIYWNGSHTIIT